MAEPKKRTNNSKQGMRRMHDHSVAPTISHCQTCHQPKESHKVCYNCGNYDGKKVITVKE